MVRELMRGIESIENYASSDKFNGPNLHDKMINRNDILLRCGEIVQDHVSREYETNVFPVCHNACPGCQRDADLMRPISEYCTFCAMLLQPA